LFPSPAQLARRGGRKPSELSSVQNRRLPSTKIATADCPRITQIHANKEITYTNESYVIMWRWLRGALRQRLWLSGAGFSRCSLWSIRVHSRYSRADLRGFSQV